MPEEKRNAYINEGGIHHLDKEYTVFGEVIEGFEVIDKIAALPDRRKRPAYHRCQNKSQNFERITPMPMYMSSKLRHIFILANILWVVIIFILCAMPSDDIPDPHWNIPHLDKVVHFGMYFVLSILLIFPLEEYSCLKLSRIYLIAILVALIYGGGIEILQANFFNRSGDVWIWSQMFQAASQAVCVILL